MQLTAEQLEAAGRAQRLLADPVFRETVETLSEIAAEAAIAAAEAVEREEQRQRVLALRSILTSLQQAAELPEALKLAEARARAFE